MDVCRVLGGLDAGGRAEAWAGIGRNAPLFCAWCVSAAGACVGFLVFLISFCLLDKDAGARAAPTCFALVDVPVAFFLGFSALYAPLLYFGQRTLVMLVLVGAAASAAVLAYCAHALFGPSHPAFGFTVVLAVHCLVMDVGVWGVSWLNHIDSVDIV